jgi:hypothetical protein
VRGLHGAGHDTKEEALMKQYLLSVCYPPDAEQPAPDELEKIMNDVGVVDQEMRAAGVWVFAGGLHPASTATVVRVTDGEVLMTDGPFAEEEERLGGFSIITAPDLGSALEWGARLAAATTTPIEVRPFQGDVG